MDIWDVVSKEHGNRLPTVRISKIAIKNIKGVNNGCVEFACSKSFVPEGTQSDILGIYGQNGSGKTTLIQVLNIVKALICGRMLPPRVVDIISVDADFSFVEIHFDFQYPNLDVRDVVYSFKITRQPISKDVREETSDEIEPEDFVNRKVGPLVFDEKIECSGKINGKKIKRQPIFEVYEDDTFGPTTKIKDYFLSTSLKDNEYKLSSISFLAKKEGRSVLFSNDLFSLFVKDTESTNYVEIIKELKLFADYFLFVFSSKANMFVRGNFVLPIFTEKGRLYIKTDRPNVFTKDFFDMIKTDFDSISLVLSKWIPGLELIFTNVFDTKNEEGEDSVSFELASKRGDKVMPIRYEADGVRKIIMYLKVLIAAFNQKSTTVAIDELDAGVFEFLLGEMLELFEKHGKGQLIFTSHNLRPLEVLDKKFLCFTTANPENRYIRMKSVGHTNNLRLLYLKEIMLGGTQDEQLYKKEKQFAILGAIKKCNVYGEDD